MKSSMYTEAQIVSASTVVHDVRTSTWPCCRRYPIGNARIIAGAEYHKDLNIGVWASIIILGDHSELIHGITNERRVHPALVGAIQSFNAASKAHSVEYLSTCPELVHRMQTWKSVNRTKNPPAEKYWQTIFEYAIAHNAKWKLLEGFGCAKLLAKDTSLFEEFLNFLKIKDHIDRLIKENKIG